MKNILAMTAALVVMMGVASVSATAHESANPCAMKHMKNHNPCAMKHMKNHNPCSMKHGSKW